MKAERLKRKQDRQRTQRANRNWTTEQDEVGIFSKEPLTVSSPEEDEICLAEHYSRFLSSKFQPQLFITVASESPIDDESLRLVISQGMRFYSRNKKGVSHIDYFSVDGEQPIRNLTTSEKHFNHIHASVGTDCFINELNLKEHIKSIVDALKGAAKRTYKGQIRKSKSLCDASKGQTSFKSKVAPDLQKIRLNIDIKLITDDGVQAGLYSIVKHKNLTVYPTVCSHKEHKCNKHITWDEKKESIKRPVEEKGLMKLSKREQTKIKMVYGERMCANTTPLNGTNKDTTRTPASNQRNDDRLRRT